jgi:hypothetical protein
VKGGEGLEPPTAWTTNRTGRALRQSVNYLTRGIGPQMDPSSSVPGPLNAEEAATTGLFANRGDRI